MENGLKWLWVNCSGRHCVSGIHYLIVGLWCICKEMFWKCVVSSRLFICLPVRIISVNAEQVFIKFLLAIFIVAPCIT